MSVRVMTFNIRHGRGMDDRVDLGRIAAVIRRHRPDVVGLQEVDRHYGERSAFVDQAWWLGRELGMSSLFGAGLREPPPGPGRPDREYGLAILTGHDVVRWASVPLPTRPGNEGRTLLRAALEVHGRDVRFWTTHLSVESEALRIRQAEAILDMVAEDGPPHALVGDLNARPESPTIARLTEVLDDAWPIGGDGTPGHTFDALDPSIRIDYILTGPRAKAVGVEVVDVGGATDHRAIVAALEITD
ncbi:MAG TPA: endonuclease/exonuclease/phosphatase family protein [Actinopolymorphaceae bacterium]